MKIRKIKITAENGITLVALVITIIILIILSTITINAAFGEHGLIERAQQAKNLTEEATLKEQESLNYLMSEYANMMAEDENTPTEPEEPDQGGTEGGNTGTEPEEPIPTIPSTVEEAKEEGEAFEETTEIKDSEGNDVTIPGEFEIAEDSGTSVEEGIVIEDSKGNQFVWIPVGTYKTSNGTKTNNLSRRTFTSSRATEVSGDSVIQTSYYGEENDRLVKDQIELFKTSAIRYGGFYIGRYEQGEKNVCKAGVEPYSFIAKSEAKTNAEAMYSGNNYIVSELISSYAWDTTLNFICQTNSAGYLLATTTNNNYGNMRTNSKTKTGEYTADKYSNIFDFLGNCAESTTEDSNNGSDVSRGGRYDIVNFSASSRQGNDPDYGYDYLSFRVQLYIK